jgi:alpha/beta hydrolase family protein
VLNAAFAALDHWVRGGKPPKSSPRLDVLPGPPATIARDANGVGMGGVRTPQVDVPIADFTGQQPGPIICELFGTTTPFDSAKLAALYPTHRSFVTEYRKALARSVKAGWILKPDARLMKAWAAGSSIGD